MFLFFPAQAITTLLGSSRLLPWQLPVNIPAEFSHCQGESATFSLQQIDWTFPQKIRELSRADGVRTELLYLLMSEVTVHGLQSDLIDLDLSCRVAEV